VDRTILRFDADSAQPDLVASDIAWGRHGLSVGIVVDRADAATLRLMLSESLAMVAKLTARCGQYEVIVARLRAARRAA
jgi:hypothetical protein